MVASPAGPPFDIFAGRGAAPPGRRGWPPLRLGSSNGGFYAPAAPRPVGAGFPPVLHAGGPAYSAGPRAPSHGRPSRRRYALGGPRATPPTVPCLPGVRRPLRARGPPYRVPLRPAHFLLSRLRATAPLTKGEPKGSKVAPCGAIKCEAKPQTFFGGRVRYLFGGRLPSVASRQLPSERGAFFACGRGKNKEADAWGGRFWGVGLFYFSALEVVAFVAGVADGEAFFGENAVGDDGAEEVRFIH